MKNNSLALTLKNYQEVFDQPKTHPFFELLEIKAVYKTTTNICLNKNLVKFLFKKII